MTPAPAKTPPDGLAKRFKQRILHTYFVRCDMSLILAVVVISGVLTSKLLLECGVRSLEVRYPLALLASFFAFLLLIRIWIWYVFPRKSGSRLDVDCDLPDFGSPDGGSGSVHFGGGDSGGGGASDSWDATGSSNSSGGGGSGFDLDLDDGAILVLLAALVLAIFCAGGYLIFVAPEILPEAAWQAVLASGLARIAKPAQHRKWLRGVVRASSFPFAGVLVLVVALAWVAHHHCPGAVKLAEALHCPAP